MSNIILKYNLLEDIKKTKKIIKIVNESIVDCECIAELILESDVVVDGLLENTEILRLDVSVTKSNGVMTKYKNVIEISGDLNMMGVQDGFCTIVKKIKTIN